MTSQASSFVIIGAGGFAREAASVWQDCRNAGTHVPHLLGFIAPQAAVETWNEIPVLGDDEWAMKNLPPETGFLIGIGEAQIRQKIAQEYEKAGFVPQSLIHPQSRVGSTCTIGPGSIICAGTTLTVDIVLGRHVLCNLHCTIGHDTIVGDFSVLSPGVHLSGQTKIGLSGELGTGAVTLPGITISDNVIVGAGAVVTKTLKESGIYAGVPATRIG